MPFTMFRHYETETQTLYIKPFSSGETPDWNWSCHKGTGEPQLTDKVVRIVVEQGITEIKSGLFYGFKDVETVEIADSVTFIGKDAFKSCSNLRQIRIPDSVTDIFGSAFSCTGLKTISWPANCSYVATEMFFGCLELTSFIYRGELRSIQTNAFADCERLKIRKLEVKAYIGEFAFENCISIDSLSLKVTAIESNAFSGCSSLKCLRLDGCKVLCDHAFNNCNLEEVEIYSPWIHHNANPWSTNDNQYQFGNNPNLTEIKVYLNLYKPLRSETRKSAHFTHYIYLNPDNLGLSNQMIQTLHKTATGSSNCKHSIQLQTLSGDFVYPDLSKTADLLQFKHEVSLLLKTRAKINLIGSIVLFDLEDGDSD